MKVSFHDIIIVTLANYFQSEGTFGHELSLSPDTTNYAPQMPGYFWQTGCECLQMSAKRFSDQLRPITAYLLTTQIRFWRVV